MDFRNDNAGPESGLLSITGSLGPEEIRRQYRQYQFSGLYAFYAKVNSLQDVATEYLQVSHRATDAPEWVLLYVGQAQMTSKRRFLGVRCLKHCGGHTYEAQSQLRLGLCGILLERLGLRPCYKSKIRGSGHFIYLDRGDKANLTAWCDRHVRLKIARLNPGTREHLDHVERSLILNCRPLLNSEHSLHPFSSKLRTLKDSFLAAGLERPYPTDPSSPK
jgi:hypothetical protein